MMRKIWIAVLISSFLAVPSARSGQEEKPEEPAPRHRVVNLSLFYPVSLNRSKHDTANISLSLLYGRLGSVRGFDFSFGAAAVENSLEGVQLAGLFAVAGESLKGGQIAGLFGVAGERGEGFQLAGLGNIAGEEFNGVQIAGLFNVAGERLNGAQLSWLFNVAGQAARGLQSSFLFNVAGDQLDGIQISGLFNVAGEGSRAFQFAGLMNVTGGTCRGLQVGAFNLTGKLTGVQVGLVNAAGEIEGVPVGLVNLTRKEDRRIQMTAWAGSLTYLNVGIRIWAKRFYSVLYLGGWNLPQDIEKCLGYGFQYGYSFPLRSAGEGGTRKRIDVDAGYVYLDNSEFFSHREGIPDRHVVSVRGALAYEFSSHVSLFGGIGLGYRVEYGTSFSGGHLFPLAFGGIEIF
jgi:opacity protein-like surface antigen